MRSYIGLGSNLAYPINQIRRALQELIKLPGTRVLASSRLYRNPAMDVAGHQPQPDYINAVAILETRLSPLTLLRLLLKLERQHGRTRQRHWGPRPLDLDLLLYGQARLKLSRLILPHPGLHLRAFVLQPLAELAPNLVIPGRGRVSRLRTRHNPRELHRII